MTWPQARMACGFNNKYLVVMDTTQEWEFINKAIRNRTGVPNNEWHIGLWKNRTTGQWTWINGKRLTIAKWQRDKPQQNDFYAVIYKGFSCSTYGSFDSVQGDTRRGWICEEETGVTVLSFKFGLINGVDNVNCPPYRDSKSVSPSSE